MVGEDKITVFFGKTYPIKAEKLPLHIHQSTALAYGAESRGGVFS